MSIYRIETGQNIFDLALQNFGSVENIYDIIVGNNLEDAGTMPVEGTEIVYNATGKGDELIKNITNVNKLKYANNQEAGSFNISFNPDFD